MIYDEDLSLIHEEGFLNFVRGAAPGVIATLRRLGIRRGRIVELGCGGGRLAARLARAGFDVVGVDASAPMIRFARRRTKRARFIRTSMDAVRLPPCDAVVAVEAICYLGSRRRTERLLGRVAAALRPGGDCCARPACAGACSADTAPSACRRACSW